MRFMRSAASRSTRSWSVLKILLLRRAPNKSCFATLSSPAGASYSLPNWRVSAVCCGSSFGCCGSSSVGTGVGSGLTLVCPRGGSVRGAGIQGARGGGGEGGGGGGGAGCRWASLSRSLEIRRCFSHSLVLLFTALNAVPSYCFHGCPLHLHASSSFQVGSSLHTTNHQTYQT